MEALRPEHYLEVAQERMRQAELLYQQKECYALAMYLAGLAVECMLRAFKARKDRVFDERHDLKRLFQASGIVDFVQDPEGDEIRAGVNSVHVMWSNYLRYASEARLRIHLRKDPVLRRRVKGDILKASALRLVETARRTVSPVSELMDLLIKTRRLLRRAFPRPAQIDLEEFHGIMGEVTSRAFRGLNGTQRQAMLRTALKDNLKPQEWKQIGLIVAITPEERRLKAELDSLCNGY